MFIYYEPQYSAQKTQHAHDNLLVCERLDRSDWKCTAQNRSVQYAMFIRNAYNGFSAAARTCTRALYQAHTNTLHTLANYAYYHCPCAVRTEYRA